MSYDQPVESHNQTKHKMIMCFTVCVFVVNSEDIMCARGSQYLLYSLILLSMAVIDAHTGTHTLYPIIPDASGLVVFSPAPPA